MRTIIQSISLAVGFITVMSLIIFGANYGINHYPNYGDSFLIVAFVAGLAAMAVTIVIISKIEKGEL